MIKQCRLIYCQAMFCSQIMETSTVIGNTSEQHWNLREENGEGDGKIII